MKKIFITIIVMFIVASNVNSAPTFCLLDWFEGDYYAYTQTKTDPQSTNLGFCYMTNKQVSKNQILGESMVIKNFEPSSALNKLEAEVVKTEYLENGTIVIYAYTKKINKTVSMFDKQVNLQIAYKEESSVIGWPLIYGSF